MDSRTRQSVLGRKPRFRIRVEGLEDRCVLSGAYAVDGFVTSIEWNPASDWGSSTVATLPFNGPVLSVPANVADGRTPSVAYSDGAPSTIFVQPVGGGWSNIVVGRDLPVPGSVAGEVRLTLPGNPADQVVFGFQIVVSYAPPLSSSTATPRALVNSSPIYSFATQAGPTSPPLTTPPMVPPPIPGGGEVPPPPVSPPPISPPPAAPDPRSAAPIGQSPFEAGATRTASDLQSVRGVSTVVDWTIPASASTQSANGALGYTFIHAPEIVVSDRLSEPRQSVDAPVRTWDGNRSATLARTSDAPAPVIPHGVALPEAMPADGSPGVRELLERIAAEDVREAVWPIARDKEAERAADRRPYWFLAVMFSLGASQYFRPRDESLPDFAVI